jgi:ferritin-like metal-binding protein YciE
MAQATTTKRSATIREAGKEMGLEDLLITKLRVLYNIENEIIKALPKMAQKATDKELQSGFEQHVDETRKQAEKLEDVFQKLGAEAEGMESEAIKGAIEDTKWMMDEIPQGAALDAELAAAAQSVEHMEIAGYGTAVAWAKETGHQDVAKILGEILQEEKDTDAKLNKLAISKLNSAACE